MTGRHLKQNAGPEQIARARRFRSEMPAAEQKLWQAIRGRKLNDLKFAASFRSKTSPLILSAWNTPS